MQSRIYIPQAQLTDDHALLVLGVGAFGARIVDILRQEFDRTQLPAERVQLLVWNPQGELSEENTFMAFDATAYTEDPQQEKLREHIGHLQAAELAAAEESPTSGFVAMHHNGSGNLKDSVQQALDKLRAANPQNKLRMIVTGSLGEGSVAGGLSPFLFHLRRHLTLRKVELEVMLATGEGLAVSPAAQEQADLRCASGISHWQRVVLGDGTTADPGRHGIREDQTFEGPLLQHTVIFSGGVGGESYSPGVLASIIANNILCLETTALHLQLEEERAHHGEELFEQGWQDAQGANVPTRCATFHAGGLKADCIPAVFHLRTVRAFVETVTQSLVDANRDKSRATALRCVEEARLAPTEVVHDLEVGRHPLTQAEIRGAQLDSSQLHDFINGRLEEDLGQILSLAKQPKAPPKHQVLVEQAQLQINSVAMRLASNDSGYLPSAVEFYRTMEKELIRLRDSVEERCVWAQRELGHSPSRNRLDKLLMRLESDTSARGEGLRGRFAETLTVALPIQIRKILEVADEIREHALVVGTAPLLLSYYTILANACERQREDLQKFIYDLNNAAAVCVRQEGDLQRAARSAFTYQQGRFEELVDALWTRARSTAGAMRVPKLMQHLGGDLPSLTDVEALPHRLLELTLEDAQRLAACGEEILSAEPLVRQALQEAILQLHPTLRLDRQRFGSLQTLRRRYVICTRSFLRAHADLFEDYLHIESASPWNIWISEHEEGFPFTIVEHVARCMDRYLDEQNEDDARRACATVDDYAALQSSRS